MSPAAVPALRIVTGKERVVVATRWGALAVGLLLASAAPVPAGSAAAACVLLVGAVVATAASAAPWLTVAGCALPAVSVAVSGGWRSPFVPCLIPPVLALGLERGAAVAAGTAPLLVAVAGGGDVSPAALVWLAELVLVAVLAGRARAVDGETAAARELAEANRLLVALHRVARVLPTSLDLADVVGTAERELGALLGGRPVTLEVHAGPHGPHGAPPDAADDGVFLLRARGATVGALRVGGGADLTASERALLDEAAAHTALAVDNARWFARLRSLGASQERARVARELHDRLGQDLAALGFQLDRIADRLPASEVAELTAARRQLREVVGALRASLVQLREPAGDEDMASSLATFLASVEARSGIRTLLRAPPGRRLPPALERELLGIAREAVVNAERHAHATTVLVSLGQRGPATVLEVVDDGTGMTPAAGGGHFGLLGMRERADAIGADLEIDSHVGVGTTVRCRVPAA